MVTSFKSIRLPHYLQNMLVHRDCLFHETIRTNNFSKYKAFSVKFAKKLKRYNLRLEKMVVESRIRQSFYKYINKKINGPSHVGCLKREGVVATTAQDKANLLANTFAKVYQNDDGITPSRFSSAVDPMTDLPWFESNQLYDLLMKCPNLPLLHLTSSRSSFSKKLLVSYVDLSRTFSTNQ